jgi:hypothetical protein
MNRREFERYISHFNNRRYQELTAYFAPDVTVEYFDNGAYAGTPARTLRGARGFLDNYTALHDHTREALEIGAFLAKGNLLFVELYTEFHTFKDPPADSGRTWRAGDVTIMTNFILYDLEGEKMKRIRIAHWRMHDPREARLLPTPR